MHFVDVVESRKKRACAVVIALALAAILIAAVVLLSRAFDLNELQGILD